MKLMNEANAAYGLQSLSVFYKYSLKLKETIMVVLICSCLESNKSEL